MPISALPDRLDVALENLWNCSRPVSTRSLSGRTAAEGRLGHPCGAFAVASTMAETLALHSACVVRLDRRVDHSKEEASETTHRYCVPRVVGPRLPGGLGALVFGTIAALSWLSWLILMVGATFFQDPMPTLGAMTWSAVRNTGAALGCVAISYYAQRRARVPSQHLTRKSGIDPEAQE